MPGDRELPGWYLPLLDYLYYPLAFSPLLLSWVCLKGRGLDDHLETLEAIKIWVRKSLEFYSAEGAKTRWINRLGNYKCLQTFTHIFKHCAPPYFFSKGVKDNIPSPLVLGSARHPKMFFFCFASRPPQGAGNKLLLPPFSSSLIESATLRLHGSWASSRNFYGLTVLVVHSLYLIFTHRGVTAAAMHVVEHFMPAPVHTRGFLEIMTTCQAGA